jgi:hypothetical protein
VQPTRRTVLVGSAAALSAACTSGGKAAPAPIDPDVAISAAAVAREQALLASYDAAIAATPALAAKLGPLRADHLAHLTALGGSYTPGTASAQDLKALERTTAAAHSAAVLTASRRLAPLLASLAAAEASHLVVL